ncbi:MAG TPA: hypothetical protein VGC79_06615, partial [Polyangiaceae bacterium]
MTKRHRNSSIIELLQAKAARGTGFAERKNTMSDFRKIAFVGNYLPRKCGIATFTHDLRAAVQGALPDGQCSVIAVSDGKENYEYSDEVRFEIAEQNPDDYLRAAEYLNLLNVDVVS